MRRPVSEFMKQLDEISNYRGKAYGRAYLLFDAEEAYSHKILEFKGYLALSDAFKCLYLETVEAVNTKVRPPPDQPLSEFYGLLVPRLAQSFVALCGAERVATKGYPLQGYTLIRNVFDNLLYTSAALQKITDFYSIDGIQPGQTLTLEASRSLRKKTEFSVRKTMTGEDSGLSASTVAQIQVWDSMFDYETHGARLSATQAKGWMQGNQPLAALPTYEQLPWTIFMNRFTEVAWMLHRLLPNLQAPGYMFDEHWGRNWSVIDLSFKEAVSALTEQMGKPIGAALVELVDRKFPFNAESTFPM